MPPTQPMCCSEGKTQDRAASWDGLKACRPSFRPSRGTTQRRVSTDLNTRWRVARRTGSTPCRCKRIMWCSEGLTYVRPDDQQP